MAKGAGMIKPNMATMLAFLVVMRLLPKGRCKTLWSETVDHSFNRVTVDGDTSTNDAAMLVATGQAGNAELTDADDPALPERAAHCSCWRWSWPRPSYAMARGPASLWRWRVDRRPARQKRWKWPIPLPIRRW